MPKATAAPAQEAPAHLIIYHGPINMVGARGVERELSALTGHDNPNVTLCLCSGGGDVCAGMGLYNFIKMMPYPVTTYAFGNCGSIAVSIFLAGASRIAAPASQFQLHAASYAEGPRSGEVAENTTLIALPFRQELGWDEATVNRFFGSPAENHFGTEEALSLAIATEVRGLVARKGDVIIHSITDV